MSMSKVHEIVKVSEHGRRDCRYQCARFIRSSRSERVVDKIVDVSE